MLTYIFIVDTSASMNQVTRTGVPLIDYAKSALDHFVKVNREPARYVLVTCSPEQHLRLAFCDTNAFLHEVKQLQANDLSDIPTALRAGMAFVNRHRTPSLENFGRGRVPWLLQPVHACVVTDGDTLTGPTGAAAQWHNVVPSIGPASDLSQSGFKWDQRLSLCVLQVSSDSLVRCDR